MTPASPLPLAANDAVDPGDPLVLKAEALAESTGHLSAAGLLTAMIEEHFPGRLALVSSFGAESVVLLDMIAAIAPDLPILFLNTGKLFGETLRYRDRLIDRLGLRDVREIKPDPAAIAEADPLGDLWMRDPARCCALRKIAPLDRALTGFDAWITGRKRYQSTARAALARVEAADGRIKINPLADWTAGDVEAQLISCGLPPHPLVADGYRSIGCMPCTDRVAPDEAARAGRWRGSEKTECGIHLARQPQAAEAPAQRARGVSRSA